MIPIAVGDVDGVGDLRVGHAFLATAAVTAASLHDASVLGCYSVPL